MYKTKALKQVNTFCLLVTSSIKLYSLFLVFVVFLLPFFLVSGLDRGKNRNIQCLSQITLEDQMSKNVQGLHIFTYGKLLFKKIEQFQMSDMPLSYGFMT